MATINYVTIEFPDTIQKWGECIVNTEHFKVYKNKHQRGVIFRIPHGVEVGDLCHVFIEHEVNLSNTIRTGTLTMKVQLTFIPVHIGVFSGFEVLKGSYHTEWFDEDGYSSGEDYFRPDYQNRENVKKIVPLPVNMKTNLFEYLNELIFNQVQDLDIINKYAVSLGCQKEKLKGLVKFIIAPENTGSSLNGRNAHQKTMYFFEGINQKAISLIPVQKKLFE